MIAELSPFVQQLLQSALVVLIPMVLTFLVAFGGLLWQYARLWLRAKLTERQWLFVNDVGAMAVGAAEQTLSLISPEAKKQFALKLFNDLLTVFLRASKLTLSDDMKAQ